jgi:hypothetical protein
LEREKANIRPFGGAYLMKYQLEFSSELFRVQVRTYKATYTYTYTAHNAFFGTIKNVVPVFLARQDCDTSNDINKLSA